MACELASTPPLSLLAAAAEQLAAACGPAAAAAPSWEDKLQAVSTALHGSVGKPAAAAAGPQALGGYLRELAEAITAAPATNQVTFLPLGLGMRAVLRAVIAAAVAAAPTKHVVLVVDRPAQALSAADALRQELGLPVGVFSGGDFLYDFATELGRAAVVVITAGLLLRLLKTGQYAFPRASLVIVRDAFTVIRNHPANTVVRGGCGAGCTRGCVCTRVQQVGTAGAAEAQQGLGVPGWVHPGGRCQEWVQGRWVEGLGGVEGPAAAVCMHGRGV